MCVVEQRVHGVGAEERHCNPVKILERLLVVFFRFLLKLGELVFILKDDFVANKVGGGDDADVDHACDLPRLEENTESLSDKDHPGGVLVVVKEVEEDDGLHEDVGEDSAHTDADVVLLVAPVGDVVLEGEHFEDAVQDGDENGGTEKVDVGVNEYALEFFELRAGAGGLTERRVGVVGGLLERVIHRSEDLELKERHWEDVDVQRNRTDTVVRGLLGVHGKSQNVRHSAVELNHMVLQLPELVVVDDRVIPTILPTLVTSIGLL